MAEQTATTLQPLPIPPDFPVQWEHPDEEHLFWTRDDMHFPNLLTPLEIDLELGSGDSFNRAFEDYEIPIRFRTRILNGYYYSTVLPAVPPDQMEAQGKIAEENLKAAMGQLEELWQNEWLPRIKQHLAAWDAFDLRGASAAELQEHLDETCERLNELWHIHFRIVFPCYLAISLFHEYYQEVFEDAGTFDALKLLQGFGNKTVETGHALWDLSEQARQSAQISRIFHEKPTGEVLSSLEALPAAQEFLVALDAYLAEYGQRSDLWGLIAPSWIEDPTPVIETLKDYITGPRYDPRAELARLAANREQAIAETRERLQVYPQAARDTFEFLLKAAQIGTILSEDHGFWIDFNGTYKVRRVIMEFARRFAEAGAIENPQDIFYLTLDELRETIADLPATDRREQVKQRKAEAERLRAITPPPALGTPPPGPPPQDPLSRAIGKFFGAPAEPSDDPNILNGAPGSPGKARGPARVLDSIKEMHKLRDGDILVAHTTAPPWTPLFATAAAVVTATGGVLSHCAVVAREYAIPAVVGVSGATKMIQDGQMLEVDGEAGIVRILENA